MVGQRPWRPPDPFRFAADMQRPLEGRTWTDSVREVEALGYSTLFVPDHFDEGLGPIAAMATAAAVTTTLNVGHARARLRLPPSGGARPRAGDDRPAVGGPARGRARRRLEARSTTTARASRWTRRRCASTA